MQQVIAMIRIPINRVIFANVNRLNLSLQIYKKMLISDGILLKNHNCSLIFPKRRSRFMYCAMISRRFSAVKSGHRTGEKKSSL